MGVMRVLNVRGDVRIEWDPDDKASVDQAKAEFKRLHEDGYLLYEITEPGVPGKLVTRFSAKHKQLLAAPGARTAVDKKTGSRPRAMAGGPVATAERARR